MVAFLSQLRYTNPVIPVNHVVGEYNDLCDIRRR